MTYTPSLASYQALSVVDAKGDLIVGTAADTTARKAVGANGTVAQADSGDAAGIVWREFPQALVATLETTTSATFTDLTTVGPAVTATIGPSGKALVILTALFRNPTASCAADMSFAVSGATTRAASTTYFLGFVSPDYPMLSSVLPVSGLTSGSNTFTVKYKAGGGGTANFSERTIVVIPL